MISPRSCKKCGDILICKCGHGDKTVPKKCDFCTWWDAKPNNWSDMLIKRVDSGTSRCSSPGCDNSESSTSTVHL